MGIVGTVFVLMCKKAYTYALIYKRRLVMNIVKTAVISQATTHKRNTTIRI